MLISRAKFCIEIIGNNCFFFCFGALLIHLFNLCANRVQAVYMTTTVPQNMKGSNIMGSHLPTRQSLRHSRMLVGKKSFPGKAPTFAIPFRSALHLPKLAGSIDFFYAIFQKFPFFSRFFSFSAPKSTGHPPSEGGQILVQFPHFGWSGDIMPGPVAVLVGAQHPSKREPVLERSYCEQFSRVLNSHINPPSAPSVNASPKCIPFFCTPQLMLSGILGLIVIAFKPIPRQKLRQHFITFLRTNSTLVTIIAGGCTLLAASFATIHLVHILSPTTECRPVHMLIDSSACTCSFDIIPPVNQSHPANIPKVDGEILSGSYYRYAQLCRIVDHLDMCVEKQASLVAFLLLLFVAFFVLMLILIAFSHTEI